MQFLRNGRVRVSFCQKDVHDRYLSEGIHFGDQDIPVTRDGQNVTVVYIRDLPYEVPSDDVVDFSSSYGEVLTAERSVAAKFPGLCNGNRILKMILNQDLPYFLSVCGCQCRVWYRGQPIQCFVCREVGHRAQSSPLSGRCRNFQNFSETGIEWASKAKAHIRLQVKAVLLAKEFDLTNSDLRRWTENDIRDVSNVFCEMLSVPSSLMDFAFKYVKSFWNNA